MDPSYLVERVDALRAELDAMRPLDPERVRAAMQRLRIEWTFHSNKLEGNSLTYGETRALLMRNAAAGGKSFRDHLDIKGHREAVRFLEEVVQRGDALTLGLVREMHKVLLVEPYKIPAETPEGLPTTKTVVPGEFKTLPNNVLTETGEKHYYARPEEVQALMQDLIDQVRDGWPEVEEGAVHPVLFASDVHHRFAEIHPFDDGNGRMARLLMNLVLMRAGYPPAVLRQENRPAYYGALAAADGGDLEPFVRFVADELAATMELYLRALRGEPDPDAFGRRLALLKREVETADAPVERSPEVLAQIARQFIVPFLNRLDSGFRAMAPFFNRLKSNGVYTDPSGRQSFPGDQLADSISTSEWVSFARHHALEGFSKAPSENVLLIVNGSTGNEHLALTSTNVGGVLARIEYNRIPSEGEAVQLADRVLNAVLDQIAELNRQADSRAS